MIHAASNAADASSSTATTWWRRLNPSVRFPITRGARYVLAYPGRKPNGCVFRRLMEIVGARKLENRLFVRVAC